MKQPRTSSLRLAGFVSLAVLTLVTFALAGPPLLCHPFDIGKAKSLPWNGTSWNLSGNENFDTANLARETLALLDSNTPVIVRMETLRRATLYANKDPQAAKELLTKLHARAGAAESGKPQDALAWFDFGYLVETYHQALGKDRNPALGLEGYSFVKKALALRGNDPQMEFAAALITLQGPNQEHVEHSQKAIAGAKTDALLARNLAIRFLNNETVAEALTQNAKLGGKR